MSYYKIISIANTNIVSLEEAKNYLKIDHDEDDNILKDCIITSIETAENFLNFSLRLKTISLNSSLGLIAKIRLPILPFAEIVSCKSVYKDQEQDISERCFVSQDGQYFNLLDSALDKINLIYKAGFIDMGQIPSSIKQGVLYHVAEIYDKQVISSSFMDEVLRFYKPFRKILI